MLRRPVYHRNITLFGSTSAEKANPSHRAVSFWTWLDSTQAVLISRFRRQGAHATIIAMQQVLRSPKAYGITLMASHPEPVLRYYQRAMGEQVQNIEDEARHREHTDYQLLIAKVPRDSGLPDAYLLFIKGTVSGLPLPQPLLTSPREDLLLLQRDSTSPRCAS